MTPTRHAIFLLLVLALLLAGCEQTPVRPGEEGADTPRAQLAEELARAAEARPAAPATPPPAVADELLPPMVAPVARPVEPRFDFDVNRAPARAFFMSLVKGTPYNMVVHPDVEGQISLTLSNVTVPEVMELVRRVYGYEYERSGNGYIVLPVRLQSRIFYVDYLHLKRLGESNTRISSGQLTEGGNSREAGDAVVRGGDEQVVESFGSRVKTSSASDVWAELAETIRTLIGEAEGRSVIVSPQANMVVVRAMPGELREVEEFLAGAQGTLQRQVILEAKILEVTLSEGFQAGINWAGLGDNSSGDSILLGQTGGGTVFSGDNGGVSEIAGQGGNLDPNNLDMVSSALTSAFGGVFTMALQAGDFTAFIELLESQGDVQVLSSPRVSTVNNQKAVIKVGTDEYFVTDIETTTTTGTATTTSPSVTLTPFFSGIALDVTPQIGGDGQVTLHIHPTVSEVQDQRKDIVIGAQDLSLPLAFSKVRESDSIIRAKSGQIVVIGGLMQDTVEDRTAKTPLLGDVPLLGNLFRHTQQVRRKTELVILLRPVVVDGDRVWQDQLRGTSQRMEQLQRGAPR
ncbi:MAG: pilus (MSHA type) biogenesis protein MshL [Chromatiales bacterium]|nr:pilus (MSHA type) biogenesis protein MshL [Chromatiales bacterium]